MRFVWTNIYQMARCSYACKPFARAKYSISLFTFIYSEILQKFPLQPTLANVSPEESIHFVTLHLFTLRRWGFLRNFPLQLLPQESIHFRSYSLVGVLHWVARHARLDANDRICYGSERWTFFNCFRVGPSISRLSVLWGLSRGEVWWLFSPELNIAPTSSHGN